MPTYSKFSQLAAMVLISTLTGCASYEPIADDYRKTITTPKAWYSQGVKQPVEADWLGMLQDTQAKHLIELALKNNRTLQKTQLDLEIAKQQVVVSGSALWPSLDVSFSSSRRYQPSNESYANSNGLDLNLSYELDAWGKLSAQARSANLQVMALQASLQAQTHALISDVVIAWLNVVEAHKQVALLQQRVTLAEQNLDIIESGYQQGLNSALDVYLTRNEFNSELSRLSAQQNSQQQRIRTLELLLGDYPSGALAIEAELPVLTESVPVGLPSELLTRKPALIASWYNLLSKDASLAYAHKQRFPSLKLNASIGPDSNELSDLLAGGNIAWSLLGSITAPLFNAGRLEANSEKAKLELKKQELSYLDTLYSAFQNVENHLSTEQSLLQQSNSVALASKNAKQAEQLSFEQYQKGLVSYTTVLDAQKRAFDAQSNLITIQSQLLTNRIQLHLALGGDFTVESLSQEKNND